MKANRHIPFWGIVTALLFSSCVKDTLYDTPHPNKGAVTITVQNTTAGDNYVAEIDGQTIDITSSPFTLPGLLEAGVYRLVIHNCPEGFTFDKSTAQVVALTDNTENSSNKDDNPAIIPLPGYLYTISQEITITAEKDTEFWLIPSELYKNLLTESAPLANYTNELMAARFSDVMWLIEQVLWKSLDKRLAAFLLEEAAIEDSNELKITHEIIANHLGSHREVITRMLRYFQSDGIVKLSRGKITLLNPERLEELASS